MILEVHLIIVTDAAPEEAPVDPFIVPLCRPSHDDHLPVDQAMSRAGRPILEDHLANDTLVAILLCP